METEGDGPDVYLRRLIHDNFGVLGYVILNKSGIPVEYHGIDQAKATQYAALITAMVDNTRDFLDTCERQRDPMIEPELQVLRLRTKKHEIIITPNEDFIFIVIQNPNYIEEEETNNSNKEDKGEYSD